MKKNITYLVVSILVISCCLVVVNNDIMADDKENVKVGIIYSVSDPQRAGGWDRAHYTGNKVLEEEFGWEVSIAEDVPYPRLAETAGNYAQKGYDIVIFTSSGHTEGWMEVAPKYPNTWFVMMSEANKLPDSKKVTAWSPDLYAYGTIVGVTASMVSESNNIGVIGGHPILALKSMFSGIIEGAKMVNKNTEVNVSWVGDWVDVAKYSEVAGLQINKGSDVLFCVGGFGTKGVLEAASKKEIDVIGYAADWYDTSPEAILTSILVDTTSMYRELANKYLSGELEKKIRHVSTEQYSPANFHGKISKELEEKINTKIENIQNGEIDIPRKNHF